MLYYLVSLVEKYLIRVLKMENKHNNPVFIITTGRTGSTLLQRYVNCSKDLVIWGEHGGFITNLANAYKNFTTGKVHDNIVNGRQYARNLINKKLPINMPIEWCNNFTDEDFYANLR